MSTSPSLLHVRRPSPSASDLLSTTVVPSTFVAKPCLPAQLPQVDAEDQVEVVLTACASNLSMSDPSESSISIDTTEDCAALSTSPQSTHSEASTSNHSLALSRISSKSAFKSFFIEALTGVTGVSSTINTNELKRERSLPEGVMGYALSKESWTPDCDALSCFHPSCPVTFSALSISNRRHHCRMCGQIYCAQHTARSAPLLSPSSSAVRNERVCEACIDESSGTAGLLSAGSSAISLTELALDATASRPQPHVTRTAFRPSFNRSHSNPSSSSASDRKPRALAPIQPWMDGQGVLSLYPLAAKRSRRAISPNEPCAAAPLFAPSASAKKHKSRATVEPEFVPANWGYRREAFDESWTSEDGEETSEDEEDAKGGLVVNGPFMLRAHPERLTKKHSAPPALMAGVTKAYAGDWSTF